MISLTPILTSAKIHPGLEESSDPFQTVITETLTYAKCKKSEIYVCWVEILQIYRTLTG